jgi:hypothetical protein
MGKFAILRVEPLRTRGRGKGSLYRSLRHLDKHDKAAEISRPELSCQNVSDNVAKQYDYKAILSLCDDFRAKHNKSVDEYNKTATKGKKRHLKADAQQCFEVLMTFSPEMSGKIDMREFQKQCQSFMESEFISKGCRLVRFELHMDEETPHISAVCVAFNEKTQSAAARSYFAGNKALSQMQDRFADRMKSLGLERGLSRYQRYQTIRKAAISAGYGDKLADVKRYAADNNIELPKYREHKSLKQWKLETQKEVAALQEQIENNKEVLASLTVDIMTAEGDKNDLLRQKEQIENDIKRQQYMLEHIADSVLDDDFTTPYDRQFNDFER